MSTRLRRVTQRRIPTSSARSRSSAADWYQAVKAILQRSAAVAGGLRCSGSLLSAVVAQGRRRRRPGPRTRRCCRTATRYAAPANTTAKLFRRGEQTWEPLLSP
eukprot:6175470-Pleurochrysis_carterae.AAC.3